MKLRVILNAIEANEAISLEVFDSRKLQLALKYEYAVIEMINQFNGNVHLCSDYDVCEIVARDVVDRVGSDWFQIVDLKGILEDYLERETNLIQVGDTWITREIASNLFIL